MKTEKMNYMEQSVDDLKNLSSELAKEIFALKNELSLNRKLEKPHLLRLKKQERAKVLGAITRKEQNNPLIQEGHHGTK